MGRGLGSLVLLVLVVVSMVSVLPSSSQVGGTSQLYYNELIYNLTRTVLGYNSTTWKTDKFKGGISVIGIDNPSNVDKVLVHLFDLSLPDSFSYKPVSLEDNLTKTLININIRRDKNHNYVMVGNYGSVYLIGPQKYGGMGVFFNVYAYRSIRVSEIRVTLSNGTILKVPSYKELLHYKDKGAVKVEVIGNVTPVKLNVVVSGDVRYKNWTPIRISCDMPCDSKPYETIEFSAIYDVPFLPPKGEKPKLSEYGSILTLFYNVSTWTYDPEYQYFVGSGSGIAWNASCKYGDAPTDRDKYTVRWMGPGSFVNMYSLFIAGYIDDICCHLPAYYINFLPRWCKAGKMYGVINYTIPDFIRNRVTHIPLGSASAYIPHTGITAIYSNGTMYFFKVGRPPTWIADYVTRPLVFRYNSSVRFNYDYPQKTPKFEIGHVETGFGNIVDMWFIDTHTLVLLKGDHRTIEILRYTSDLSTDPLLVSTPSSVRSFTLNSRVVTGVLHDSTLYLSLVSGEILTIRDGKLSIIGTLKPDPIDIGIYGDYLVVLYNDSMSLYNLRNRLVQDYHESLNYSFRWVVPSSHFILLVGGNHVSVYSLEPKLDFLSGGGVGRAVLELSSTSSSTTTNGHDTTSSVKRSTSSSHTSTIQVSLTNSDQSNPETSVGVVKHETYTYVLLLVLLVVVFVSGYVVMRFK